MHEKIDEKSLDTGLATVIKEIGTRAFPQALTAFLRSCVDFDNFIVIAYNGEKSPTVLYREFTNSVVYQSMDSEYVTAAYLLDPFYKAHLQGVSSGLHRLFDIAPDRFRQTSYFKAYYAKTTLLDEIAAFAKTSSGGTITACLGTDTSSGRSFSKKGITALKRYESVISTLIELNWREFAADSANAPLPIVDRLISTLKRESGIHLSPRQAEVALYILQGHSSKSTGLTLGISVHTVKIFRKQLYAKCNISSQAELFSMFLPLLSDSRPIS